MIFVDTGAWYASMDKADRRYEAARQWLRNNKVRLITSDLVIVETVTLLRKRVGHLIAVDFGERLMRQHLAHVQFSGEDDFQQAWRVFRDYADKEWSFSDCHSKWIMRKLEITTAFAFDNHFRQFGDIVVVPDWEEVR